MKKLVAVLMAILMLGSAVALGASAIVYKGYTVQPDEILVILKFGDSTSRDNITYRDFATGNDTLGMATGEVAMIIKAGAPYTLPAVTCPSGQAFAAWVNVDSGESLGIGSRTTSNVDGGTVVQYTLQTTPAAAEKDTMETIKTILVKVFGILIGLFYGDTDYGQELVASFFNSVFGAL